MLTATSDNTSALSLALDARIAIKALKVYRKSGTQGQGVQKAVNDAIESLRALSSGASLFDKISPSSPYETYSQIQTLREVETEFADEHLVDKLAASIEDASPADREQSIDYAINFFVALENRALRKYNQSFSYGT